MPSSPKTTTFKNPLTDNTLTVENPLTPLLPQGNAAPPTPWTTRANTALTRAASTVGNTLQHAASKATPHLTRATTKTKQAVTAAALVTADTVKHLAHNTAEVVRNAATEATHVMKGEFVLTGECANDLLDKIMGKLQKDFVQRTKDQEWFQNANKRNTELRQPVTNLLNKIPPLLKSKASPLRFFTAPFEIIAENAIIATAFATTKPNSTGFTDLSGFPELRKALEKKLSQNKSILFKPITDQLSKITITTETGENETFYITLTEIERGTSQQQGILKEGWRRTETKEFSGRFKPFIINIPNELAYPEIPGSKNGVTHKVVIGSFFSAGTVRDLNNGNDETGRFSPPSINLTKPDPQPLIAALMRRTGYEPMSLEDRLSILTQQHKNEIRKLYGQEQPVTGEQIPATANRAPGSASSSRAHQGPETTEFFKV